MTSTADITAAPAEVELSGKTYRMSPITDRDFGEFERYTRSLIVQAGRDAAEACPEDADAILASAFAAAGAVHIGGEACMAQLRTPEGLFRLAWYSLRANHPDMTIEECRALMKQPGNFPNAMDKLEELMPKKKKAEPSKNAGAAASPAPP